MPPPAAAAAAAAASVGCGEASRRRARWVAVCEGEECEKEEQEVLRRVRSDGRQRGGGHRQTDTDTTHERTEREIQGEGVSGATADEASNIRGDVLCCRSAHSRSFLSPCYHTPPVPLIPDTYHSPTTLSQEKKIISLSGVQALCITAHR